MLLNFDWNAKIGSEMERILAIFLRHCGQTIFFSCHRNMRHFLTVHVVRASAWSGGVLVRKVPNSHS